MPESFRKIEIISDLYIPSINKYLYIKKYIIMPDGNIFLTHYNGKNLTDRYNKAFSVRPSDIKRLYNRIRFIADNTNNNITFYNDCGITVKIYHRFGHKTLNGNIAFIGDNHEFVLNCIVHSFLRKHCNETISHIHKNN